MSGGAKVFIFALILALIVLSIASVVLVDRATDALANEKALVRRLTLHAKSYDSLKVIADRYLSYRLTAHTLMMAYDGRRACRLSYFEAWAYAVLMNDFADFYVVDWQVYGATIWTESQYKTTLKSKKNCLGIAQFLPSTMEVEAETCNVYYKANETPWNDVLCLSLGINHLSRAIAKHDVNTGFKTYVGGAGFSPTDAYVNWYDGTVANEYRRLKLIYRGVVAEYKDKPDSLPKLSDFIPYKKENNEPENPYRSHPLGYSGADTGK